MKKLIILIVVVVAGLGIFYWRNLRGIGPAVRPPPADITKLVPEKPQTPRDTNTTGMPLTLPPGFSISIFAKGLGAPRDITISPVDLLLASIPSQERIVALPDMEQDAVADEVVTVAQGLNRPHGIALHCVEPQPCDLYVAETDSLTKFTIDLNAFTVSNRKEVARLPTSGNHWTRTIYLAPDNKGLLVSMGSSCNACNEKDPRRAAISYFDFTTQTLRPYANGLRNSVFMTMRPGNQIWATEMGRDLLGDDTPPDEINIIAENKNYGWPICYGKNIHDTQFDKNVYIRDPCTDKTPSRVDLPAHSAPLGLIFIPIDDRWPRVWWGDLLVAFHGSWNRSVPTGYKVVRIDLDEAGNYLGTYDFITGWLTEKGALGRPVDLLVDPGRLFISDDKAGVIYLVRWDGETKETDEVTIESPRPNEVVSSPLQVRGKARGNWFFEANLPVRIEDANAKVLGQVGAQAKGDLPAEQAGWMTTKLVPFEATLEFKTPETDTGTLVMLKDNPSGLPQHAREVRIPIRFK